MPPPRFTLSAHLSDLPLYLHVRVTTTTLTMFTTHPPTHPRTTPFPLFPLSSPQKNDESFDNVWLCFEDVEQLVETNYWKACREKCEQSDYVHPERLEKIPKEKMIEVHVYTGDRHEHNTHHVAHIAHNALSLPLPY
jgi:hypothetical protein